MHVIFDSLTCVGQTCSNEEMFSTRSSDGGLTWSSPVRVRDFNLVSFSGANTPGPQDSRGIDRFGAVDADNSGGTCDGTLYATFTDFMTGGLPRYRRLVQPFHRRWRNLERPAARQRRR